MTMSDNSIYNQFDVIEWVDIAATIALVDPELADIIDRHPGSKKYKLVKVSYPYGENIIKAGSFYFPNKHGMLAPFHSNTIENSIKKMFDYYWGSIPFGILLSGAAECYWSGSKQTTSLSMLYPGSTYALRTIFDKNGWCNFKDAFDLSSGARSIFLLPSIKDTIKFKKLGKSLENRITIPKDFNEQWYLLKDIYKSKINKTCWKSEFLFFTTQWLKDIFSEKPNELYNCLRNRVWAVTEFSRNRKIFDYIWNDFIRIAKKEGVKAKDYLFDLAKHLVLIGIGDEYGFQPTISNQVAPIDLFQKAFIKYYKITQTPTFMSSATIKMDKPDNVYFSLQHSANLLTYPHRIGVSSSLDDVRDVKAIMDLFMECLKKVTLSVKGTRFTELPDKVHYSYYHTDKDYTRQAMNSALVMQNDERFNYKSNLEFCNSSLFFKGCVQISTK